MHKKLIYTFFFTLMLSLSALADKTESNPEINENLWTTGNIYIVLIVLGIIFLGMLFFLLHLDRKVRRLERDVFDETK